MLPNDKEKGVSLDTKHQSQRCNNPKEGNLGDEDDEDFDDIAEVENDIHQLIADDDLAKPDPEDDDHLPNDDLQ